MNQRETRNETILVVDDEDTILDLLSATLRFAGFRVQTAATGRDALAAVRDAEPDLIVLDVNLPDVDGFEVCRRLREGQHDAPVIFLTARDAAADLRTGFTRGGDDYLTKPFSLEELMLRIQAILRRTRGNGSESPRLVSGGLVLDQEAHRVWRGSTEVSLSPTEFRLLRYLMLNRDRVVSRQQILDHVWDYDFYGEPTAVETYISYLRRKLDDRSGQLIRTVRGVGYSLRTPQTDAWAS
jgi:two-component system OmpR family response regulator